ncbi:hypothetical protein BJ960_000839 [Leucobacter aridicollis]|uniref:Uncharacterized protein n=1 Tax=Leucobacter aridicollis TaxID=283878 RepID=A0A852R9P5_9MICO|nr:hypothetical protein [Leucobacter aridicollis]
MHGDEPEDEPVYDDAHDEAWIEARRMERKNIG